MSQELSLASTDDLINELLERFDNGVIALSRPSKTGDGFTKYKLRWRGCAFKAAGLASAIIYQINSEREDNETKLEPDEV